MNTAEKLNSLASETPSRWNELAGWIKQNKSWLKYSQRVAVAVHKALEKNDGLTQKELAAKLDVSPQYISKILKGQENMTLKTIVGLEDALGIRILDINPFKEDVMSASAVDCYEPVL